MYWSLIQNMHCICRTLPQPCKTLSSSRCFQGSLQKAIPPVYSASYFRMMQYMGRPVNSIQLIPHFICCKMNSLVRSNVVWNMKMVNNALFEFIDGGFGRSMQAEEANLHPEDVSITVKIKYPVFYDINRQYNQLGGSLIPLGNGLIWGLSVTLCCL